MSYFSSYWPLLTGKSLFYPRSMLNFLNTCCYEYKIMWYLIMWLCCFRAWPLVKCRPNVYAQICTTKSARLFIALLLFEWDSLDNFWVRRDSSNYLLRRCSVKRFHKMLNQIAVSIFYHILWLILMTHAILAINFSESYIFFIKSWYQNPDSIYWLFSVQLHLKSLYD